MQLTPVAGTPPKDTEVDPGMKSVPDTTTAVPPAVGPSAGDRPVTVGTAS